MTTEDSFVGAPMAYARGGGNLESPCPSTAESPSSRSTRSNRVLGLSGDVVGGGSRRTHKRGSAPKQSTPSTPLVPSSTASTAESPTQIMALNNASPHQPAGAVVAYNKAAMARASGRLPGDPSRPNAVRSGDPAPPSRTGGAPRTAALVESGTGTDGLAVPHRRRHREENIGAKTAVGGGEVDPVSGVPEQPGQSLEDVSEMFSCLDQVADVIKSLNLKAVHSLPPSDRQMADGLISTTTRNTKELLKHLQEISDQPVKVSSQAMPVKVLPPQEMPSSPTVGGSSIKDDQRSPLHSESSTISGLTPANIRRRRPHSAQRDRDTALPEKPKASPLPHPTSSTLDPHGQMMPSSVPLPSPPTPPPPPPSMAAGPTTPTAASAVHGSIRAPVPVSSPGGRGNAATHYPLSGEMATSAAPPPVSKPHREGIAPRGRVGSAPRVATPTTRLARIPAGAHAGMGSRQRHVRSSPQTGQSNAPSQTSESCHSGIATHATTPSLVSLPPSSNSSPLATPRTRTIPFPSAPVLPLRGSGNTSALVPPPQTRQLPQTAAPLTTPPPSDIATAAQVTRTSSYKPTTTSGAPKMTEFLPHNSDKEQSQRQRLESLNNEHPTISQQRQVNDKLSAATADYERLVRGARPSRDRQDDGKHNTTTMGDETSRPSPPQQPLSSGASSAPFAKSRGHSLSELALLTRNGPQSRISTPSSKTLTLTSAQLTSEMRRGVHPSASSPPFDLPDSAFSWPPPSKPPPSSGASSRHDYDVMRGGYDPGAVKRAGPSPTRSTAEQTRPSGYRHAPTRNYGRHMDRTHTNASSHLSSPMDSTRETGFNRPNNLHPSHVRASPTSSPGAEAALRRPNRAANRHSQVREVEGGLGENNPPPNRAPTRAPPGSSAKGDRGDRWGRGGRPVAPSSRPRLADRDQRTQSDASVIRRDSPRSGAVMNTSEKGGGGGVGGERRGTGSAAEDPKLINIEEATALTSRTVSCEILPTPSPTPNTARSPRSDAGGERQPSTARDVVLSTLTDVITSSMSRSRQRQQEKESSQRRANLLLSGTGAASSQPAAQTVQPVEQPSQPAEQLPQPPQRSSQPQQPLQLSQQFPVPAKEPSQQAGQPVHQTVKPGGRSGPPDPSTLR